MASVGISNFVRKPVKIFSGTSDSQVVNVLGYILVGVVFPAGWDTASITFKGSIDSGATYQDLYEDDGSEITWAGAAANRALITRAGEPILGGLETLIVRSGTSGTPVNQAADRQLQLLFAVVNP